MKIDIICAGKVKEKYYRDAIDEYMKRLSRYDRMSILEVKDEKTPESASEHQEELIRRTEGERMQKLISPQAFVIALAIDGRKYDSPGLAAELASLALKGVSHVQFVIGGSLGLSDEILKNADMKLSFSDMTFPHQLMRVILLEQIYRCEKINHHEPYHK